ncbi:MAG: magnesium transporter, partial [Candidatus Polarisedimenticolia bacterium]
MTAPAPAPPRPAPGPRPYRRVIRRFVRLGARDEVARLLDRMHPADVVETLRTLSPPERKTFVDMLLAHERAGSVLADLPEPVLADLLAQVGDERVAVLVARQPPDEGADLLGLLPEARVESVLGRLDEKTSAVLDRLLTYGRETAGGMMTTRFVALERRTRIGEAIARIRSEPEAEMVFYVYVVDESGRLDGVVSLRQLVLARPEQELHAIMNPRVIRVRAVQSRAEVTDVISRYNLLAVPVVDASNTLLGIVTVDDAIDVLTDQTTREVYRMAGLNTEDRVTSPALASVRRRLPWNILNLGTALLASTVVWLFEGSIEQIVALATFMPIVAGMGGNGATQTLTVITRGIALGELDFSTARRAILKEVLVGLTIGVATGTLMAVIAFLWKGNPKLGMVIGLAMVLNLFVAGL